MPDYNEFGHLIVRFQTGKEWKPETQLHIYTHIHDSRQEFPKCAETPVSLFKPCIASFIDHIPLFTKHWQFPLVYVLFFPTFLNTRSSIPKALECLQKGHLCLVLAIAHNAKKSLPQISVLWSHLKSKSPVLEASNETPFFKIRKISKHVLEDNFVIKKTQLHWLKNTFLLFF